MEQHIPEVIITVSVDKTWETMKHTFLHGKKRGETTHFKEFDQNFSWKKGEITLVIGRAGSGKTEFILQLMLMRSVFNGWKWGVFSPENAPIDEFLDSLIHAYVGKTTDPLYRHYQMTLEDYRRGYDFIREHFFYIYPDGMHTIQEIDSQFNKLILEKKVNGTLIDPFNQVYIPKNGRRDDDFLSDILTERKRIAVQNQLCDIITTHPKGMPKNQKTGEYEVVDVFDINMGAMWSNKADNIISVYRPHQSKDPANTEVEMHVKKIKKQKLVGIPGMCKFDFNRKTNRYYIADMNPLDPKPVPVERITPAKDKPIQQSIEELYNDKDDVQF